MPFEYFAIQRLDYDISDEAKPDDVKYDTLLMYFIHHACNIPRFRPFTLISPPLDKARAALIFTPFNCGIELIIGNTLDKPALKIKMQYINKCICYKFGENIENSYCENCQGHEEELDHARGNFGYGSNYNTDEYCSEDIKDYESKNVFDVFGENIDYIDENPRFQCEQCRHAIYDIRHITALFANDVEICDNEAAKNKENFHDFAACFQWAECALRTNTLPYIDNEIVKDIYSSLFG